MTADPPRRRPSGAPELPDILRERPVAARASEPRESRMSSLATGLALGMDLVASIAGGLILGWLADRWLGTDPFGVLVGLGLGMALAMTRIVRRAQSLEAERRSRQKPASSGRRSDPS